MFLANGYPQRDIDEQTLQQITAYKAHVILWLYRLSDHVPLVRLRHMLEEELPYLGDLRKLDFKSHCDICLRAKSEKHSHSGHLVTGVQNGAHNAVDVQDPYIPPKFNKKRYEVGFIEYKSRYLLCLFVNGKEAVYNCGEPYLAHELANLRSHNNVLKQHTVVPTSDVGEEVYRRMLCRLSEYGVLQ